MRSWNKALTPSLLHEGGKGTSRRLVSSFGWGLYEPQLLPAKNAGRDLIWTDPVKSDIPWSDIESLFGALGATITQRSGSRVGVELSGVRQVFHRPHPERVTDKGAVKSVREFLETAGYAPEEEDI